MHMVPMRLPELKVVRKKAKTTPTIGSSEVNQSLQNWRIVFFVFTPVYVSFAYVRARLLSAKISPRVQQHVVQAPKEMQSAPLQIIL